MFPYIAIKTLLYFKRISSPLLEGNLYPLTGYKGKTNLELSPFIKAFLSQLFPDPTGEKSDKLRNAGASN